MFGIDESYLGKRLETLPDIIGRLEAEIAKWGEAVRRSGAQID